MGQITNEQVEAANDFIRDNASKYASAKSDRVHLQEFRKSKKAMLMNTKTGPQHERESYAYAHKEYLEVLEGIKIALKKEETLRWQMKAAELKIEMWRSQQFMNRDIDNSHR